ncbi:Zn-ribbon domain-containing OB-fold protein [Novosphingobium sp. BL-52-GroH]|uniref:Zn-ribbon domain-containing OB-fold protein n=1 Tax=Novosphingobium sp. BL-52-GroH TaxID=3349877 RepID=UPI00384D20A9
MTPPQPGLGAEPGPEVAPLRDIIADQSHLRDEGAGTRLIGSVCAACGTACFPRREVCLNCGSRDVAERLLGPNGSLYTFTTVHVSSSRAVPYTIGYVDLAEGVRLLASVLGEDLVPDMAVTLTTTDEGFAFVPRGQEKLA